ncbi:hypothetical protein PTMSG1_10198 [Pyrenophora teres f. maculata]|nr:hypothetical protein PTMSG1_10198 [Pyrenophora teres f. maculata]
MLLSPLLLAFFASTAVAEKFGYVIGPCSLPGIRSCKKLHNTQCTVYGDINGKYTTQVCIQPTGVCTCPGDHPSGAGARLYGNRYGYECGC